MTKKEKTVGRNPINDIALINNSYVSGNHAILKQLDDGLIEITDLNSKNGTWVNGEKMTGTFKVRITDIIEFANAEVDLTKHFDYDSTKISLDFTQEFEKLRNIDDLFDKKKKEINANYTNKLLIVRAIAILVAYLIIYKLLPIEDQAIKMGLIAIFGLFSSQISFGKDKLEKDLLDWKIKKGQEYCCPNRKCKVALKESWIDYQLSSKGCFKCKAKYFKD